MTISKLRTLRITRPAIWLFALVLLMLAAIPVFAQEATPHVPTDDEVNAIAKGLYCPVCENIPLDVCGTQACAQWRELIREKLAAGWSEGEIKQYFVTQYGDRVLAEPPRRGFNWLVYVVPPVLVLAGILLILKVFRAWQLAPSPETEVSPSSEPVDEYIRRLEEELKKRE